MSTEEHCQKLSLSANGSKANIIFDFVLPSTDLIRPTPPQGVRKLHSARSQKVLRKCQNPSSESTKLSFCTTAFEATPQTSPIIVVLDTDLPKTAIRKQSIIFSPRKEDGRSLQNNQGMLVSRCRDEKNPPLKALTNCEISISSPKFAPQIHFQLDVISATITPRPCLPANFHQQPQSPRIARKTTGDTSGISEGRAAATLSAGDRCILPSENELKMRMKRRMGDFNVGSLDINDLPEDIRNLHSSFEQRDKISDFKRHEEFNNTSENEQEKSSNAKQVSELEGRVQTCMHQNQFNKHACQKIILKATSDNESSLKIALPHPSPAQLFIVSQPILKLGQTTTTTMPANESHQRASLHSVPIGEKSEGCNHLEDSKERSGKCLRQQVIPKQKNTFHLQNSAFVLKYVAKSNPRTTPFQEIQRPILFNRIGPINTKNSVHDGKAADAAFAALAAKPQQLVKHSAEHQKHHLMCNNRVPDYFLAAMHRK
jgi:hypothetical protein